MKMQFQRPIVKPYSSMYPWAVLLSMSSNWECAIASFPYLIGEIYWTQPSHDGRESVFAMNPPNRIIGIVKRGAIAVAELTLGVIEETKRPIPMAVFATKTMVRYKMRKWV